MKVNRMANLDYDYLHRSFICLGAHVAQAIEATRVRGVYAEMYSLEGLSGLQLGFVISDHSTTMRDCQSVTRMTSEDVCAKMFSVSVLSFVRIEVFMLLPFRSNSSLPRSSIKASTLFQCRLLSLTQALSRVTSKRTK